jgi:hypothetical protein
LPFIVFRCVEMHGTVLYRMAWHCIVKFCIRLYGIVVYLMNLNLCCVKHA